MIFPISYNRKMIIKKIAKFNAALRIFLAMANRELPTVGNHMVNPKSKDTQEPYRKTHYCE